MELIVLSVLVIAALAFAMAHNKQEKIDQIDSQNSRYESWFADNRRNELGGIIYIYELEGNRFKIGSTQRSGVVRAVEFQEKYHVNYIPGSVEQLVVPKSFLLEDVENLVRRHFYMSGAYELDLEIGREVLRFGSGNAFDSIVEEWKTVVSVTLGKAPPDALNSYRVGKELPCVTSELRNLGAAAALTAEILTEMPKLFRSALEKADEFAAYERENQEKKVNREN